MVGSGPVHLGVDSEEKGDYTNGDPLMGQAMNGVSQSGVLCGGDKYL